MNDTVAIRPAQRSDVPPLGALWAAFLDEQTALDARIDAAPDALERWRNDAPLWLEDETHRLFVAETSDKDSRDTNSHLFGFVAAQQWAPPPIYRADPEVYLTELYVVPSRRRSGIATRLVDAVCDWADDKGATRVRLHMLAANDAARAFWQHCGATPLTETHVIERSSTGSSSEASSDSSDVLERNSPRIGFQWNPSHSEDVRG